MLRRSRLAALLVPALLLAGASLASADVPSPQRLAEQDRPAEIDNAKGAAAPVGEHTAEPAQEAAHHEEGEEFSWFTALVPEHTQKAMKEQIAQKIAPKSFLDKENFAESGKLTHVFMAFVAFVLVLIGAVLTRRRLDASSDAGVLPERKFGIFLFYEGIIGAVWNLMRNMMGAEEARRHFPIICTLAFYIFVNNALALIPGGAPATANLNTNIVMGLTVFLATHISGIRVQGPMGYLKHFAGPILVLAPLMIAIELISHCVRPLSLSLRLLGNMTGDHKVLEIFLGFKLPLLPLPLMFLGLMVVCIQTLVFVLLSTVYLSMAVAHHDHGDEAHGHH
jgi:F-type H+-transporting ATPase subunit a